LSARGTLTLLNNALLSTHFRVAEHLGGDQISQYMRVWTQFVCQSTLYFNFPFSNLAMAGGDTEAGKKRKELARIMTSRQVPNPLD
jgi:hypothetical protein